MCNGPAPATRLLRALPALTVTEHIKRTLLPKSWHSWIEKAARSPLLCPHMNCTVSVIVIYRTMGILILSHIPLWRTVYWFTFTCSAP